jgi:hypothetical protein
MIVSHPSLLSSSVLILNRSYMAVHLVSVRQACLLLYREAAEVIDVEDGRYMNYDYRSWSEMSELRDELGDLTGEWIQLVRQRLLVPRILRLVQFDRVIQQSVRFSRRNLFARDQQACQYCGKQLSFGQMSVDHVVPRSQGGETSWDNIVCCCVKCNTLKGGRTPQQARMKLPLLPAKPSRFPLLPVKHDHPCYSLWQVFMPTPSATGRQVQKKA